MIYVLWKNYAILNDIDFKRTSSSCSQGHNLHARVTGFVHAFSDIFFPLDDSLFQFLQSKGNSLFNKIMQWKT